MTDILEQDALNDTTWANDSPPPSAHPHETVKAFIATPRMDEGVIEKLSKWVKGQGLKSFLQFARKDGLRHMFIVTSNSYEDREGETITSDALKAYEQSCFPGEDLFHCDNPLLWWHDDDVVMGEAVTVNYSEPFLVEVFRELPNPVSKVLWDYAENNGHNAGASHRFGYLEKDRDEDGTFHRIFKQETSYLPERSLAANDRTYAGVIMASPQSDKRLDEIFEQVAGIKGASAKLHAKTGELEKELEAAGISHKALPPKVVAPNPKSPVETEMIEDEAEIEIEDDAKENAAPPLSIEGISNAFNQFMAIVMDLVDAQGGVLDNQMGMMKAHEDVMKDLTEIKEMRVSEKAQDTSTIKDLQEKLKALSDKVKGLEDRANLAPRSASRTSGETDPDMAKKMIGDAIDKVKEARDHEGETYDPFYGWLKPLPKG